MERSQPLLQLSQTHLQILSTCPRKFQSLFLEQLALPQPSLGSEQRQLGVQFHQLMQQQEMGLEIQPLLNDNPQLQRWFDQFQQFPPLMIAGTRLSEHSDALGFQNFILVAVYDLLIQGPQQAQIIDWKTYRRPPNIQVLQQNWQTQLYLFMLAETSGYTPEQISMTYWFAEVRGSGATQSHWINIPYTSQLHKQTQQALSLLLTTLSQWMEDFRKGIPMPQAPFSAGYCLSSTQQCPFLGHCDRDSGQDETSLEALMDMGAITEVPL
jgi:hypothetical protein